ncbi:MAG: putative lipopolysaccharide heptosyltransferase III [Burkholderiales bacterium]
MTPDAPDVARFKRALVIKLRHHGDVLLAAPVFSALKRAAPQLAIDALVYADTADMLSGHPAIDTLHVIDRAWKDAGLFARTRQEWALAGRLKARGYDLLIHLSTHRRGMALARSLKPQVAVAPRRDGEAAWQKSFTHLYAMPREGNRRHTVEVNLDALRRIGIHPAEDERALSLVAGSAAEARVEALIAAHGLARGAYVHLHPASRWMFKTWPAERNAALIDRLADSGSRVVVTCAPSEVELGFVKRILALTRSPVIDLGGQLSLKEMAALTARAKVFVGVDSAPMHIASAVGTPVVALFGPSGDREWGPWGVAHRIVASTRHPCRPCGNDGCGGSKVSECLTTLPVARVEDAIRSLANDAA